MSAVDPYIVETWIKGWSLAREVPPPVKEGDGFRVDVGWPQQRVRYVFPKVSSTFQHLAETIQEPWHFLKVCTPPEVIHSLLPPQWMIQPTGYMMTCSGPMSTTKTCLLEGYTLTLETDVVVPIAKIYAADGAVAAMGRVVFVNDFAIYDRIETHPDHRRRGLGSVLMKALEAFSADHGRKKGLLVATAQGKALYETMGWQLHTLYTTAVILD
ncbi:MAG TPA: GNAT family N-acetyltransferase [Flavisolibacter sp.]|nr:GNAT family N-acetyltransferase [Flavisolibacter sp.]